MALDPTTGSTPFAYQNSDTTPEVTLGAVQNSITDPLAPQESQAVSSVDCKIDYFDKKKLVDILLKHLGTSCFEFGVYLGVPYPILEEQLFQPARMLDKISAIISPWLESGDSQFSTLIEAASRTSEGLPLMRELEASKDALLVSEERTQYRRARELSVPFLHSKSLHIKHEYHRLTKELKQLKQRHITLSQQLDRDVTLSPEAQFPFPEPPLFSEQSPRAKVYFHFPNLVFFLKDEVANIDMLSLHLLIPGLKVSQYKFEIRNTPLFILFIRILHCWVQSENASVTNLQKAIKEISNFNLLKKIDEKNTDNMLEQLVSTIPYGYEIDTLHLETKEVKDQLTKEVIEQQQVNSQLTDTINELQLSIKELESELDSAMIRKQQLLEEQKIKQQLQREQETKRKQQLQREQETKRQQQIAQKQKLDCEQKILNLSIPHGVQNPIRTLICAALTPLDGRVRQFEISANIPDSAWSYQQKSCDNNVIYEWINVYKSKNRNQDPNIKALIEVINNMQDTEQKQKDQAIANLFEKLQHLVSL